MRLRKQDNLTSPFCHPFNVCVTKANQYVQQLNLQFVILPLPPPEDSHDDQLGLKEQLLNNRCFIQSDLNPDTPDKPPEFLLSDESTPVEERVNRIMKSVTKDRPGALVMLGKATVGVAGQKMNKKNSVKPICGILVHCGAAKKRRSSDFMSKSDKSRSIAAAQSNRPDNKDASMKDQESSQESSEDETTGDAAAASSTYSQSERSIIGAFCLPQLSNEAAQELLSVNLVRTICECICFEEIENYKARQGFSALDSSVRQQGSASTSISSLITPMPFKSRASTAPDESPYGVRFHAPDSMHDSRFMTIDTRDLLLCPTSFFECLKMLQFKHHFDNYAESVSHEDVLVCPCLRQFHKKVAAAAAAHATFSQSGYFQFYMLKASRIKDWITEVIPDLPSKEVRDYFKKTRIF